MPDHPLKLHVLRAILKRYEVWEEPWRGKGSHTLFSRRLPSTNTVVSYTVPTTRHEVLAVYVRQLRKKFLLTPSDGVSDADFYGRS